MNDSLTSVDLCPITDNFGDDINADHLILHLAMFSDKKRSFSSLRRLKTYLQSTMSQKKKLNHIGIFTCHHNKADFIDLKGILNSFVACNDIRAVPFATFP